VAEQEPVSFGCGQGEETKVQVDIFDPATARAHQMVVMMDIGVESGGSSAQIQLVDLSQGGQAVQYFVDSLQGDGRHPPLGDGVDRLRGGVCRVGVKDFKDALPLSGDLEAVPSK
jgi:hypothetical protein